MKKIQYIKYATLIVSVSLPAMAFAALDGVRSEERRVGKECVST